MGATLSYEHDPDRLQAAKDAEQKVLEHYQCGDAVQEKWLEFEDRITPVKRLRVLQIGTGQRPVVFLHGGGGMAAEWAPLFQPLSKKSSPSFCFLFVELPGHGLSDPFDYSAVAVNEFAADLLQDLRKLLKQDKIDLVGNSYGAAFAIYYAQRHGEQVRSLTLVGAPCESKTTSDF